MYPAVAARKRSSMDPSTVYRQVQALIRHWGTSDPVRLAADMGIRVYDCPDFRDLLGMYTYRWKHRIVLMNPNVSEDLYRMVLAHELGHDQLHRQLAGGEGLQEFQLFRMAGRTEYEANAFAAHLLIDDEELTELVREGYDAEAAASMLCVDVNLLLIKVQQMQKLGVPLKLPYAPDGAFFRNVRE